MASLGIVGGIAALASSSTFQAGLAATTLALSAGSAIAAGEARKQEAEFESAQLEQRATEEKAIATRRAAEAKRNRDLVLSRARAVGAASGGGRDFSAEGEIDADGQFQILTALYDGSVAAQGFRTTAAARRSEGERARSAGLSKGASTLIGGASTMYEKYS